MKSISNVCVIGSELAIVLSDGTELYLSLEMLRRACPCAICQGEPDALGRVRKPMVSPGAGAFNARGFEMVGGYGLRIDWMDGHGTGIYGIDYLLKLNGLS